MVAYAKLADLSQQKQQAIGRDKFLILTGAAACRAGWPAVGDRSAVLVLAHNPNHIISRYPLFVDAMRDDDFLTFLRQLERFCSYERAEHLLRGLHVAPMPAIAEDESAGDYVLKLFSAPHWT